MLSFVTRFLSWLLFFIAIACFTLRNYRACLGNRIRIGFFPIVGLEGRRSCTWTRRPYNELSEVAARMPCYRFFANRLFSASQKEANSGHLSLSINIKEMKVQWAGGPVFPISKKERKEKRVPARRRRISQFLNSQLRDWHPRQPKQSVSTQWERNTLWPHS